MLPLTLGKNDEFVYYFFSQWNTHSLPNRTLLPPPPLVFAPTCHDPVLYISDALDLPQQLWPIGSGAERLTGRTEDSTSVFFSYSVKKKEKNNSLLKTFLYRFTWKETGSTVYIHTHTHTPTHTHGTSWYSILRHIVHLRAYVHMSHVHTTCTKKPWLPSGLVFDRMLSEWLISQCFDLLQLLELCLVRAWIWHTLQIIMWLHYTQCFLFFFFCFFFFQFCFWRDIFVLCFIY